MIRPPNAMMNVPLNLQNLLKNLKSATRLILNDLYFGDEGCKTLAEFLSENLNVIHIEIRGNNIFPEGLLIINNLIYNV